MLATDRGLAAAEGDAKRAYVKSMFAAIAPRYDFLNHLLSLNLDRVWRRRAVALVGWERAPAGRYLDACAGTLDLAAALANRPGFRGEVIGADFVHTMLRFGRTKSSRVRAVAADTLGLPFADACFDGATVGFGVRNLVELDPGLRELARVLRPGARLVILEFTPPTRKLAGALFSFYFRRILPAIGRLVSKHRTAYTYLPESVRSFPDPEFLAGRLREAGFAEVGYRRMTLGVCTLHWGTRDEGPGTRDEGPGTRDEGRGTRDEGRGTRDEGRGTRDEGPGTRDSSGDGQVLRGESLLVRYANFVKLPHTLFALPFALLGVLAASFTAPVGWRTVLLVAVAFTAARWVAMGFNRIADRKIDARNPRTRERELPRGRLTLAQAWGSVVVAGLVFVTAAAALNPLCLALSPLALAWIMAYSLSKRFTWWPHLWLGTSLAIAPVGGWLAVTGAWSDPWWLLLAITLAVATWVAGFDIFYHLADEEFDRAQGLRSAVVRLGRRRSILAAKLLHGLTIPALAIFGWGAGFGAWYFAGVVAAAGILAWEHRLVRAEDLSRLDAAFFSMNAVMSVTVFAFALVDRVV